LNWAQTQALQIGVYASVMYELKADDVTFIPGKSRIFFFQRGFQQFKCEYLYSATSIKLILIFISWKLLQTKCLTSTSVSVENKEKSVDPSSVNTVVNHGCPSLHIRLLRNTLSAPLSGRINYLGCVFLLKLLFTYFYSAGKLVLNLQKSLPAVMCGLIEGRDVCLLIRPRGNVTYF